MNVMHPITYLNARYYLKIETIKFTAAIAGLTLLAATVNATDIVHDPWNAIQNTITAIKSNEMVIQATEIATTARDQLTQAKKAYSAVTGTYNYVMNLGNVFEREKRIWTPTRWQDAMSMSDRVARGNLPGSGFEYSLKGIGGNIKRLNEKDFLRGDKRQEYIGPYIEMYGTSQVANALAERTYDANEEQNRRIDVLVSYAADADDLKKSSDVGNAALIEMNKQFAEAKVLQATQMKVLVAQENRKLAEQYAREKFLQRKNQLSGNSQDTGWNRCDDADNFIQSGNQSLRCVRSSPDGIQK